MNMTTKLALNKFRHFYLKAALFHSTPVLDRRPCSHSRPVNARRGGGGGKVNSKLLRKAESYKENRSSFWRVYQDDEHATFPSNGSWRSRNHGYGPERLKETRDRKKGFRLREDYEEDESNFGRNSRFNHRCSNDESPWNSSGNRASWNWKQRFEEEKKDNNESSKLDISETCSRNDRVALGLCGYGPLSLEHVKDAYRACALKWHPDRHNGASKEIAEEKFKVCNAAYESLCDILATKKE